MDDKSQLVRQEKPPVHTERQDAGMISGGLDGPAVGSALGPNNFSGGPICGAPDSTHCRECLAAMSHRLAQPITALRGGLELALIGKRSAADYRSLLEQSLSLADVLVQLIVSLRDLGESGAGGGPHARVGLNALATEILAELEGLAHARDLRLQFIEGEDVEVCADPLRLREALQSLLGWIIENSAGSGDVWIEVSTFQGETRVCISPPRLDLQYLQIKALEDITTPGLLFSRAAKSGSLGWAINKRLWGAMGGRLEILTEGPEAGRVRASFRCAQSNEMGNHS